MPRLDDEDITGQLDPWKRLDLVLLAQTRSLDALLNNLSGATGNTFKQADQRMIAVIVLMIQGLGASIHTVRQLTSTREMSIRDCYGIARSAAELAVNISYIAAVGESAAAQAEQHAFQRSYRDLHRKGEVGGFTFDVRAEHIPDIEHFPGLADAMGTFTRKGREVIDWTGLTPAK